MATLSINALLNSPHAMTPDQGDFIHALVGEGLLVGDEVELDFEGVQFCIPPFTNAALGSLYKQFSPELIRDKLTIINLNEVASKSLELVMRDSQQYYGDKDYAKAVDKALFKMWERMESGDW